jgi:hypothetical protein
MWHRVKALNALLAEQWQHTLQSQPEFATTLGDLRYNDRGAMLRWRMWRLSTRWPRISSSASRRSIPLVFRQ